MNKYICCDCGHEQDSMDRVCDDCNSIRVIVISLLELHSGSDWKNICFPMEYF